MPASPRRRARTPRRLPPRPTYRGATEAAGATPVGEAPPSRERTARAGRSSRLLERETPLVMKELRRVAGVSIVTFGLLIVLTVIDRVS